MGTHEHSRNGIPTGTDMDRGLLVSSGNGGLSPEVPDLMQIGMVGCCLCPPESGHALPASGQHAPRQLRSAARQPSDHIGRRRNQLCDFLGVVFLGQPAVRCRQTPVAREVVAHPGYGRFANVSHTEAETPLLCGVPVITLRAAVGKAAPSGCLWYRSSSWLRGASVRVSAPRYLSRRAEARWSRTATRSYVQMMARGEP